MIELLKVDYMNRVQDQLSDKKVHGVYFLAEDNPRFEIVYDHGSGYISIDMEDYKFLEDYYFGEEDRSIHDKRDNEVYVDQDWVYSFLTVDSE